MLKKAIVSRLDTSNISKDTTLTKARLNQIWNTTTEDERKKIAELGGYKDTRSFKISCENGKISLRLLVSICIILDLSPEFVLGETNQREKLLEEDLNKLLISNGFEKFTTDKTLEHKKIELREYINFVIDGIHEQLLEDIDKLNQEQLEVMLNSALIHNEINKGADNLKIQLMKLILIS